jgi:hypothetical protein
MAKLMRRNCADAYKKEDFGTGCAYSSIYYLDMLVCVRCHGLKVQHGYLRLQPDAFSCIKIAFRAGVIGPVTWEKSGVSPLLTACLLKHFLPFNNMDNRLKFSSWRALSYETVICYFTVKSFVVKETLIFIKKVCLPKVIMKSNASGQRLCIQSNVAGGAY